MHTQVHYFPKELLQCKAAAIETDSKERTVKIYASDESPIDRFSYDRWERYVLIISHEQSAVKLDRVKNGVCLFFENHPGGLFSNSSRLGKVTKAEIVDKKLILTLKLNRSAEADRYLQDVEDEVEPGNSIGFVINKLEVVKKATYDIDDEGYKTLKTPMVAKAIDWELQEVSAVDIPANPNAGRYEKHQFDALEKYPVEVIGDTGYEENNTQSEGLMTVNKNTEKSEAANELVVENENLKTKLAQSALENHYWRLRLQALDLYALQNKLTESEFRLDFSVSPAEDIATLLKMSSEDARIELKTIERALTRAEKKDPIDRLKDDADKTLLSNSEISSTDAPDGTVLSKSRREPAPNGKTAEQYALELVQDL